MAGITDMPPSQANGPRRRRFGRLLPVFVSFAVVLTGLIAYTVYFTTDDQSRFRLAVVPGHPAAADFQLSGSDGKAHSLADFRGRAVVLFFGFTRCPDACPGELYKLSQVMRRLGAERGRVQVLMITLDPARDTAALLRQYVTTFDPSFIGLTGSQDAIARATDGYGVILKRIALEEGDYTFEHSAALYVLDAGGRQRLRGNVATPVDDLVHDLKVLVD